MSNFTTDKPDSVGLWEFICGETDGEIERCAIVACGLDSCGLEVRSEHLGATDLDCFHHNLTEIRWRKIA